MRHSSRTSHSPYDNFMGFAAFAGGACLLCAASTGSLLPMLVGGIALFCVLCFTNGLGR